MGNHGWSNKLRIFKIYIKKARVYVWGSERRKGKGKKIQRYKKNYERANDNFKTIKLDLDLSSSYTLLIFVIQVINCNSLYSLVKL